MASSIASNASTSQGHLTSGVSGDRHDEKWSAQEKSRRWPLKYNIHHTAVTDLLKILISIVLTFLSKDSRSLLSTPRSIQLVNLSNGKLWQ